MKLEHITGWGNYPTNHSEVIEFTRLEDLQPIVLANEKLLARGMGRSYGDAALTAGKIISTRLFNRFLNFDANTGILTCESGVTISEILDHMVPRGWFVRVSPGTKFVSIGGAIASNVHGKNHHKVGAFDCGVISFRLLLANGEIVNCSRDENTDLFFSTFGSMGLTGVVGEVELQLDPIPSGYAFQRTIKCRNLEETMSVFEDNVESTHSVSWIDCLARGNQLGRSIVFLGEMATPEQVRKFHKNADPFAVKARRKLTLPFNFPTFALNGLTMKLFNNFYYHLPRPAETVVDLDGYNYPLDAIHGWNKLYGKKGFFQYQCVLPLDKSFEGYQKILGETSSFGVASFLAVLKLFGESAHYLSFPQKGYTLTMDFPVRTSTLELANRLDEIVLAYGGRIYLTKDARMSARAFQDMQALEIEEFMRKKREFDPEGKFASLQSERLELTK